MIELHIFTNCTEYIDLKTTIVDTYKSFKETFGEINPTIWVDPNPNKNRFNSYLLYLQKMFPKSKINITHSLSDGYIKMIQTTSSDYLFVLEHDWLFNSKNIHHSLNEICDEMKKHNVCHVRFNKNHNYVDDSVEWYDMTPLYYNDMFCRVLSASNNPHVINVSEYKKTAFKYLKLENGPFGIEDNLRKRDDCVFMVYGNKTNDATVIHRDGRMNRTDEIRRLYKLILGREADEGGLNNYVNSGLGLYQIQVSLWQSDEFKNRFNHINCSDDSELYNDLPIFVINLERRPDRKQEIVSKLNRLAIKNYEIVNAVDGSKLVIDSNNYDDERARQIHRRMTSSEIGCALSHIECAKKILSENLEYAVILEDDAELTIDFKNFLKSFKINEQYNFDFLILGSFGSNQFFNGKLKTKISPHVLIEKESIIYLDKIKYNIGSVTIHDSYYPTKQLDYVHGTHAYIMSKSGAEKLLKLNYPVIVEADNMWNYFPDSCNIEFTNPILCHRQHEDSDIRVARNNIIGDINNFSENFINRKNNPDFGT